MEERTLGGVTSIRIGRGLIDGVLDGSESLVAILSQPGPSSEIADSVEAVGGAAGCTVIRTTLPDGDAAKAFGTVEETIAWLADAGARRDSVIVAVGGGALTDVAGFIGSVFMRGVRTRYIPTTLLGAVDAAIGGKTAVNVAGKNLAGTFAHPEVVTIDLDIIGQNPVEILREGFVEAYKAGLIGDVSLAEDIAAHGLDTDLDSVVSRAVAVKAEIVSEDFKEAGRRAHLNFGHTIGHAVEALSGWRHGPSVAVGMVAAAAVSADRLGFTGGDVITATLERVGLPVRAPALDLADVERLVGKDKKNDASGVRMVLLEGVGRPTVTHVDATTLRIGLAAIGIS
jgi:3-dehydroquinate synthase